MKYLILLIYLSIILYRMIFNLTILGYGDPTRDFSLFLDAYNSDNYLNFITNSNVFLYSTFAYFTSIPSPYIPIFLIALAISYGFITLQLDLKIPYFIIILFSLLILLPSYTPANYITGAWRQNFAMAFFWIGFHYIYHNRIYSALAFFALSCALHYAQILYLAPLFLYFILSSKRYFIFKILIFISCIFFFSDVFFNTLNHYEEILLREDIIFDSYKIIFFIFCITSSFLFIIYKSSDVSFFINYYIITLLFICLLLLFFSIPLSIRTLNGFYYLLPIFYFYSFNDLLRKIRSK